MIKVLDAFWYSPWNLDNKQVGIVKVDTGYEIKFYIGLGNGLDEQEDIKMILERGCRFYPEVFGGNYEKI